MTAWRQIEAGMRLQEEPSPVVLQLAGWGMHYPHPEVLLLASFEGAPNLRLWNGTRHLLMMELKDL